MSSSISPAKAASNGVCETPTQSSLNDSGTTYIVQTFTRIEVNCTWTVPAWVTSIEAVIVGGGGGAGFGACGGGGGAGRLLVSNSGLSVSGGSNLTLSIGDGGVGGWTASQPAWRSGVSGVASSLTLNGNVYSAAGGGGGGGGSGSGSEGSNGLVGGSGGGGTSCGVVGSAGVATSSGVSGFTAYGFSGGAGVNSQRGGGGGGAGGAGSNGITGSGGAGRSIWGVTLAGGGGGWGSGTGGSGIGGSAGSGFDTKANSGSAGLSGTGSGGGGGNDGGSGRIMIRYLPDTTAPSFTNGTSFSFAENSATSSNAATISVSESSTITVNASGDHLLFTVVTSDSTTARIRFISSPNFESPGDTGANNVYDLSVRATDTAGNAANQSITITITNVNEAPTITTASSNPTHTITQAENITSVATYTGSDVDAGTTLTWSISGTDAADFSIDPSSGALAFAANPDFEAPADSDTNNAYILVVTLSDGSLTDTQTVTITITNANESATINAPTVSGTINKGINTTITVTINVAGKVRFFVGNKRISTCKERITSGTYPNNTATCTWKPAVTGRQYLTATLTPTDNTFSASTSARTEVFVVKRGTTR